MMQYAIMCLAFVAIFNYWRNNSFIKNAMKEIIINETKVTDDQLFKSVIADTFMLLTCLIFTSILLVNAACKIFAL